jgi:hypothetical protein
MSQPCIGDQNHGGAMDAKKFLIDEAGKAKTRGDASAALIAELSAAASMMRQPGGNTELAELLDRARIALEERVHGLRTAVPFFDPELSP